MECPTCGGQSFTPAGTGGGTTGRDVYQCRGCGDEIER